MKDLDDQVPWLRDLSVIMDGNNTEPEDLIFSTSTAVPHDEDVVVENLSILFLEEFLRKAKHQLLYGIQRDLDPKLNQKQIAYYF